MELLFEPDKWFANLFKGGRHRKKNLLLSLDEADRVLLAPLLYNALKTRSLVGAGYVGPATRFRDMVATAKKLWEQQESVRALCETASPFHSTLRWLLDQEIAYYTDPEFASGSAKPGQDATTYMNVLLLAACLFAKDRLGSPRYDDLAELIMQIDPEAKEFSADAIRVRTRQFAKNHKEMADTAPQWFPARAEQER